MSGFASSVMLGDLNDFIAPSQACVNPIFAGPKAGEGALADNEPAHAGMPKIGLAIENDLGGPMAFEPLTAEAFKAPPDLIKTSDNQTAKVSLSDCLACSGCVTSAETVLIEQQSMAEYLRAVASGEFDQVVVTLSGQSRASLAVHLGLGDASRADASLRDALKARLGADVVLDASAAGDVALIESAHEFLHRFRAASAAGQSPATASWESPRTTIAVSATEEQVNPDGAAESVVHGGEVAPAQRVPMLASACPGWICFAEKSHPEAIPYISTTKSPQQIAGALVKRFVSAATGVPPARIYHATVMPCADKKLEASRKDFFDAETETNDVDCVLTTIELAEFLGQPGGAAGQLVDAEGDAEMGDAPGGSDAAAAPTSRGPPPAQWAQLMGELASASLVGAQVVGAATGGSGGSGGYLEFVFRVAAKELFGKDLPPGPLPYKVGRNPDMRSIELVVDGKPVLKFAAAYGFRNIQSIVRQMKRGKCPYHFVEIMACPGGCLNGGGQARPPKDQTPAAGAADSPSDAAAAAMEGKLTDAAAGRRRLQQVDEVFHGRGERAPGDNPVVRRLYQVWVQGAPYSAEARRLFHTRYHAVPKLQNALLEKW